MSIIYNTCLAGLLFCILMAGNAYGEMSMKKNYLNVSGVQREFYVHKPAGIKKNAPVVIILHGGLGNALQIMNVSGMNSLADREGFIAVYPEGTGGRFRFMKDKRTWNAGRCCGTAVKHDVDDAGFLSALIDRIVKEYNADMSRVYMMGISNGAMMAYRFACEHPDKVAAIVTIAGAVAVNSCDGIKDVAVLHIHGDHDENVPLKGGKGKRSVAGVEHRSLKATLDMILSGRKCEVQKTGAFNGKVDITSYKCRDRMPVKVVIIKGGTHAWPGANTDKNRRNAANMAYPASRAGWEFVSQFSKDVSR